MNYKKCQKDNSEILKSLALQRTTEEEGVICL